MYACWLWRKQSFSQASHWSASSVVYIKHASSCCCSAAFLPALFHNNRSVMRWARLSWGPDVAGLSVGRQEQPFPLSELPRGEVIRPVYNPPIINTAGKPTPHCYCCLLLFILCPCLLPHVLRSWCNTGDFSGSTWDLSTVQIAELHIFQYQSWNFRVHDMFQNKWPQLVNLNRVKS